MIRKYERRRIASHAIGCPRDTLDALGRLHELLTRTVVDPTAVSTFVRNLARRNGGWLPETPAART